MSPAVAVAASGGRDSTALLHATARAARDLGLQVHALHVHHGLLPEADAWLEAVRAQCARWRRAGLPVSFDATRLQGRAAAGESVEAWARRGRYAALGAMARAAGCPLVLLAHHRRDQAETLLLQALRGGGPAGLAAMPRSVERDGLVWSRPWLAQPREAIEAYVRRHRLRHVDDGSNDDPRFARNRVRRSVWPALVDAFPDAEAQLAAAAARAAESAAALDELARLDATGSVDARGLDIARWLALGEARRANLLRHWLGVVARGAPDSLVRRLLQELPGRAVGQWPAPAGDLHLHRGRLSVVDTARPPAPAEGSHDLGRPGRHRLPDWGGSLVVSRVDAGGVAPELLRAATLRARAGGERFQFAPRSLPRPLKKQYQARGVPEWQRGGPLVFAGERLVFVPALGIDARCRAAPGAPQFGIEWQPAPAG